MPRTTADLVKGLIEVDSNIDLTPFIATANALVTEACVPKGYDDTRLELIERFLAAHFYTLRDPRPTSETAGPVSASYQSRVGLYLSTSHYGQHAKLLDTKGGLATIEAAASKPTRTVSATWVGKKEDEWVDEWWKT